MEAGGWMVVFSTFMIHIICDGIMYSFGIFYSPFLESFNTTSGLASLVMSIFIGICACAGPIASALLNRYGCRIVSILGTIISAAGFLLSLVIDRIEVLFVTIGVVARYKYLQYNGIGFGLMYLPTIVSVALHFKLKRATAMGISMSGSGIGSMIFAPLLEWLISYYGYWKGALLIATGILLNCLVLSFFYREFEAVVEVPIPLDEEGEPSITDIADVVGLSGSISLPRQSRVLSVAGSNIYLRRKSVASNAPGLMAKPDILYVEAQLTPRKKLEIYQWCPPSYHQSAQEPSKENLA
ncbi:monocarboxylate transporter 14 [Caerostris extrusa]|uniref:Monocarboxylate transporter 14 n=1 Tax=Caerostris extrusa TaxID=172846 RepID=A0AAV4S6L0_CAEEX|nr:monocarboxylate transporter 14 [Caerostris extrusa]